MDDQQNQNNPAMPVGGQPADIPSVPPPQPVQGEVPVSQPIEQPSTPPMPEPAPVAPGVPPVGQPANPQGGENPPAGNTGGNVA